ncbi:hypothetical protein [Aurantiacibacter marinus]|uniref:DUF4129 domain-containing protein n=1 Tax=Aurantiacibacter marinus TaxID=874156 RepID=A0A0H0XPA4_9SPHN|nr:hypothetical protein [Aurantiacibacter marinus]KLI64418.1 hypothetical protein AAV99_02070 [Aurantiacibacter marinus]
MTTGKGNDALPAQGEDFASAWQNMRADDAIQYAEVAMPERAPPPDWWVRFMAWLAELLSPVGAFFVTIWPVLSWVLGVGGIALLAYLIFRTFGPDLLAKRNRPEKSEEWTPDQQEALALLEEADRLAAAGQYDEATHLLLKRSVGQIAQARPDLVEPSSTARELSAEPRLPEGARAAFAVIAGRVERSLFALTALSATDWQAARDAYADFALAQNALGNKAVTA